MAASGHGNLAQSLSRLPRLPADIIEQTVNGPSGCIIALVSLSFRVGELILAARGAVVSYETIRDWSTRFVRLFARALKRRRLRSGDAVCDAHTCRRLLSLGHLSARPRYVELAARILNAERQRVFECLANINGDAARLGSWKIPLTRLG